MSDINENNVVVAEPAREVCYDSESAYMNRLFCSTKERVTYIAKMTVAGMSIGKYDTGTDIFFTDILHISLLDRAKANVGLVAYDLINDPLSAMIIDNMRSRWGKFKPFLFLSAVPSFAVGFINCILPMLCIALGFGEAKRLWVYMALSYITETINAFFGGGGYIDNVFTPNPNERTSLLTASKLVADLIKKLPEQICTVIFDMVGNNVIALDLIKVFVILKTIVWLIQTIPNLTWAFVSKERVAQSEKAPPPLKSVIAVFKNKPLLIHMLSGFIGGIDVGTSEALYFNNILKFNSINIIGGIPGMPISYASYAFVPKFRKRFSTKALSIMESSSIIASEALFFLVGCIGGPKKGFYKRKIPMTIAFALGNCIEMVFYATKQVIGDEINYEVLDYFEWQNGYRVEATLNLLKGYISKVQGMLLTVINAWLVERWAKFDVGDIGENVILTDQTQWRMFVAAFAPHLVFDLFSLVPMMFYNIDKRTRDRMYLELEKTRAATSANATARANAADDEE